MEREAIRENAESLSIGGLARKYGVRRIVFFVVIVNNFFMRVRVLRGKFSTVLPPLCVKQKQQQPFLHRQR